MPFELFVSYAHKDNARGQVRELRDAILADFQAFAGRELRVFFDEHDIPSMADWEKRIAQGLRESRLFLAVLSPDYFASAYCRREWEEYVRYEAMRQCLGEGVAPVYFVELPGLDQDAVGHDIAAWVAELRKRQWCDLLPWHDAGKRALEDADVARRLRSLKGELGERLGRADRARQSPTNIYRHNPQFVGRVRELTLLREALNERGSVGVVGHNAPAAAAVHGLGGLGKTELALAYAHAFAWDYPGGRWLARCDGLDNFDLVLRQLAEPLNVTLSEEEQKDARLAAERILAELRRRDRMLLLLDNVTRAELIGPDVFMRLPPQGQVHLLATTRLGPAQLAGSPHDHAFVAVDELPAGDALALIRAHQAEARFDDAEEEVAAHDLVALLAGFTLAVETAAIYLGRHAGPRAIAAYAGRLRRELLAETEASATDPAVAVRHKEKLLERTLALTFETLGAVQLRVLTLASLLPADQVALPWLRAVVSEALPEFNPDGGNAADAAWEQLVDPLLSLRVLQPGVADPVVRMHRLVQDVIKVRSSAAVPAEEKSLIAFVEARARGLWHDWVEHGGRWQLVPLTACASQWLERSPAVGVRLTNLVAMPLRNLGHYAEAERIVRQAVVRGREVPGEEHPDYGDSLHHLAELSLIAGRHQEAERLAREYLSAEERREGPDRSAAVSMGLHVLAAVLFEMNRLEEAETIARRALEMGIDLFGSSDPIVATRLNNLAQIFFTRGRMAEAEDLMRKTLQIDQRILGPRHPNVGRDLNNLGQLLKATNRLGEAEATLRRALKVDEQCLGEVHPHVAVDCNNLATLLQTLGRYVDAEVFVRRALRIDETSFGADHTSVARDLNNRAELLRATGRNAEAEPLLRRALGIDESRLGPDHPNVARDMSNLAILLQEMNRQAEAEPLMRRALASDEKSFGADHSNVAIRLNNLANLLQGANRMDEAEPLLRRALAIWERNAGAEHPDVASALNNLASLLNSAGRWRDAEPLYQRALALDEGSLGPNHPNVARDLSNLALLLRATARPTEAEPMMRRALAIHEQAFGPDHPAVATDLNNLALLLGATNRSSEAEELLRRSLVIDESTFGPDHPKVATNIANLATFLFENRRPAEAEPLMRRALLIDEKSLGPAHPKVASHLSNLAWLLHITNRPSEADRLIRRAVAIDEQGLRPDHPQVAIRLNVLAQILQAASRADEADPLLRRALAIEETAYGPEHPNVANRLNNLAALYVAGRRFGEGEPLLRRALQIHERHFGLAHPKTAMSLNNLAQLLKDTYRHEEAEPLMRRALDITVQCRGPDHPDVATDLNNLAQLLHITDRWEEAEPLFRRSLAISEQSYGRNSFMVATGLNNLAQMLQDAGRLADAEPLFRRAVVIFLKIYTQTRRQHPHFDIVYNNYVRHLARMGYRQEQIDARLHEVQFEAFEDE